MAEAKSARVPITELLPPEVQAKVRNATAAAANWATGPSYTVRHTRTYDPPVPLWQAFGHLERYRELYRRSVLRLDGGRALWLDRDAFLRLDEDDQKLRDAGVRSSGPHGGKVTTNRTAVPQALEPPLDRSYWVADERLIGGFYPGDEDPAVARWKCERLVYFGVRHVVCLMEEKEHGRRGKPFVPYLEILRAAARDRGVEVGWERHPIRDGSVPTAEGMRLILDSIDRANKSGKLVYLHCWGGRGRTGTVVGCWLARHGAAEGQAALDRIALLRSRRPDARSAAPETQEQCDMVWNWGKGE